jgi:hypothetical protein
MAHDHHHERLAPKHELRDPALESKVIELFRIVTNPRGQIESAVKAYDNMVKNFDRMEEVYNSYNLPKEELLKTIAAYKAMLASSNDLC